MKRESSKKFVTIEEHHLILDTADLMHALESDDPSRVIDSPPLQPMLVVDKAAVAPADLMAMLRKMNPEIPESARLTLAVTWQEQVEIDPAQMQQAASPAYQPPAYQPPHYPHQQPPQGYTGQPPAGYQPPVTQHPPGSAMQCRTCGTLPMLHGPTPDCMDVQGCGRVLRERGQLLPPRTVPPPGAPSMGIGASGASPPGVLVNRDTGETAFADKNGLPYGHHDDYGGR